MSKSEAQLESVYMQDRQTWRNWLVKNHRTSSGIWLVYFKVSSGKPSVQYAEAVKEALCFGWIDSKVKSIDDERYRQIFTPRKPRSVWSKLNKQYIEELIEQGLMTEAGLGKIAAAKADGSWTRLDAIEALIMPDDLQKALDENAIAQQNFESFNNSTKKNILFWIDSAKRPETRVNRVRKTVEAATQNQNPLTR